MIEKINQQMSMTDIGMLLVLSVLWGGSFFFVEVLIHYLPPLTIVTLRVGLAAITLWGLAFALKLQIPKKKQYWGALAIVGLFSNALPFCLIVWGQTQISSGLASIFNATTSFFTLIIAGIFLSDEQITRQKLIGVICGFLGTTVLIGPEALSRIGGPVLGQLAVIGASISYAISSVYSRRFKGWGMPPLIVVTGQVSMATLILLPITLIIDKPWEQPFIPLVAIGAILGLAIFSTVIAFILFFRLIASAGATNATLVTFLIPISAVLLGVTFLGETLSELQLLGMTLIGLGILVMDGRIGSLLRRAN
jgi:drug/metabolite transporter (DMT)-like permease